MTFKALFDLTNTNPLLYGSLFGVSVSVLILLGRLIPYNPISVMRAAHRLKKLKTIEDPRHQFGYLRFTDPFIFEEMVLTAFKKAGCRIKRNKKYIGDGGIDGITYIYGQKTLIQCKRYKSYIDPQHVLDFRNICVRRNLNGLFVHTGKTGPQAWDNCSEVIDIISGQKLLKLMLSYQFSP